MAEKNIGKITQVISAVLDIKFPQGGLPEINDAIEITTKDGGVLTDKLLFFYEALTPGPLCTRFAEISTLRTPSALFPYRTAHGSSHIRPL